MAGNRLNNNDIISDDNKGKSRYTHQRVRSAYLSLKRNMKWLWTFYDNKELNIPNANNALEGTFTDIKSKLRIRSGMKKLNRQKFLDEYISRHYYHLFFINIMNFDH